MVSWILKKMMGSKNQREVKRLWPLVHRVNEVDAEYQKLTDEELRAKTEEFRKRLAEGAPLDDLLPEAFAAVKNACRRLLAGNGRFAASPTSGTWCRSMCRFSAASCCIRARSRKWPQAKAKPSSPPCPFT